LTAFVEAEKPVTGITKLFSKQYRVAQLPIGHSQT